MEKSGLLSSFYEDFFTATIRPTAILDQLDTIQDLNPAMERLLGKAKHEITGQPLPLQSVLKRSEVRQISGEYYLHNGIRPVKVLLTITPIGSGMCAVEANTNTDASHTHDVIDAEFIADQVPSGIIYSVNSGVRISYANQAAGAIFNVSPNKLMADKWLDFLSPSERDDAQQAIIAVLEGQHSTLYIHPEQSKTIELRISPYRRNGQLCGAWAGVLNDISDMKNRESDLEFVATHDALTGLRNALSFRSTVEQRLLNGDFFSLAFCDINGFKAINDDWGHMFGDRVLTEVANRLRETTFDAFRYGGDEFILICECDPNTVADNVQALFAKPLRARGVEIAIGISIGVCSTDDAHTIDEILDLADHKMYKHKRNAKTEH
ncbi:sensor domain-containing diguanylate cyclase [Ferrimicrobium acidiphilum]|jgi:diguanylate cyclase (GGDEF)-like protein|uniref:sensor domain-containing diguanylate cyclase n=1 Tax=Ferrimicrobium acidiphilum TaxID=121039 RepID=UPI0023F357F7|nr:GGDEF domain-containing protein [Ferrimicrobium acidiphilum]